MAFKKLLCILLAAAAVGAISTGCGKFAPKTKSAKRNDAMRNATRKIEKTSPPAFDLDRIAADERRGIKFSDDKKTLLKCDPRLEIENYTLPNGVTAIGDEAFRDCKKLTSVTIPSSVIKIGKNAFADCKCLKNVTIPNGVSTIEYMAFKDCAITNLTLPPSVTYIGDAAFIGCAALTDVTIPGSVTIIPPGAFAFCSSLKNVTIQPGVEIISYEAFNSCAVEKLVIPSDLKVVGETAFGGCPCEAAIKRRFPNYR